MAYAAAAVSIFGVESAVGYGDGREILAPREMLPFKWFLSNYIFLLSFSQWAEVFN